MKRILGICFLGLFVAGAAAAHPHVWIESQVEVRLNGNRIEAIRAHWTFDPFFTEMIVLDHGRGTNGVFSSAQIESIRSNAFENLRHYGYFSYVEVDGIKLPVESVRRFEARMNDENFLEYSFEIPVDMPIRSSSSSIRVSMYDETFFTDIAYRADYARISGAESVRYHTELTRDRHMVPIWGPMTRETVEIIVERR
jgi:ABC-type uncharacterized transport system substrate-binding protein